MIPSVVHNRDWAGYFNGVFMHHKTYGVVYVAADRGDDGKNKLRIKRSATGDFTAANANYLSPYWPRAGAFNYKGEGFIVERRARQIMKRSASPEHYRVQLSAYGGQGTPTKSMMWAMIRGNYSAFQAATTALNRAQGGIRALARDLAIQYVKKDDFRLYVCGNEAGFITNGLFNPVSENSPAAKRARGKLLREGIQCL